MKKHYLTLTLVLILSGGYLMAQTTDTTAVLENTLRSNLYASNYGKTRIGGYGQIDYNQPVAEGTMQNGKFDVHRLVLFVGHKFNDRLSFFTEIEIEHVNEISIEQAIIELRLTSWMTLRGGLVIIPMGITNEYHEPPTFNSVERPNLERYIIPTTWREIGLGVNGNLPTSALNYQVYLVNGPLSYDNGEALFDGKNGMRSGRQKGAESISSNNPNLSWKVGYYGIRGLSLGLSGYFGKSQSTLYNGLDKNDQNAIIQADSSVVGINMFGLDARYRYKGIQIRGLVNFTNFTNTEQYNSFTGSDLGSKMMGYYVEAGFNILSLNKNIEDQLIVFSRYEVYNTHQATTAEITIDPAYNRTDITVGLHYKPFENTSFKVDYQIFSNNINSVNKNQINAGIGVWF